MPKITDPASVGHQPIPAAMIPAPTTITPSAWRGVTFRPRKNISATPDADPIHSADTSHPACATVNPNSRAKAGSAGP